MMTRRERVLAAIAHHEPDRVPIDLGGMRSTGITAIAYSRLKRHLGVHSGHTRVYDVVQPLALPEPEILEFAGSDVVDLGRAWLTEDSDWRDWTLPDGTPAQLPAYVRFEPDDGGWVVRGPRLMEGVTWSALPSAPFHKPLTPDHLADIRRRARVLFDTTDYAIMAGFGGNLLEWGEYLCRFDQFLIDLAEDRPKAERLLDKLVEMHLRNLEPF